VATKVYQLSNLGNIKITKRHSNRHLRLSIATNGDINVSIPSWASYQTGLDFVKSKSQWIIDKRPVVSILENKQPIGYAHRLYFKTKLDLAYPKARISDNQIIIYHPPELLTTDQNVQVLAQKTATRALRKQAESLLPQRLRTLAELNNLSYNSVTIKQLRRRWGSCDQNKNIVFNLYLIQLPWNLIDYVLLHELTHTEHLNHSELFWNKLQSIEPKALSLRKSLHQYNPGIIKA